MTRNDRFDQFSPDTVREDEILRAITSASDGPSGVQVGPGDAGTKVHPAGQVPVDDKSQVGVVSVHTHGDPEPQIAPSHAVRLEYAKSLHEPTGTAVPVQAAAAATVGHDAASLGLSPPTCAHVIPRQEYVLSKASLTAV